MSPANVPASLADLRRKTDRQLVHLARRELARAVELARAGARAEAQALRSSARTWLAIAKIPEKENAKLAAQIERLEAALGGAAGGSGPAPDR
jgi:hypothetical protein